MLAFLDHPVLQNELVTHLRRPRSFVLFGGYLLLMSVIVVLAWPAAERIDMTNPEKARRLINVLFLGQYLLASLLAPSLAAGAIAGEKERHSYEMLLASPLRPLGIVLGKLTASLAYIAILVGASLPIMALCLPLGGVSFVEVLGLYWLLAWSLVAYGTISIWASGHFRRTAASLVVSYLLILPIALVNMLIWFGAGEAAGAGRLFAMFVFAPTFAAVAMGLLLPATCRRLLYPPDLGSEGKEVVDADREQRQAVGLVIRRDDFPDRLFAPPQRDDLLPDNANPVFDKEMRSELFSQGTLMLRMVIQVSMLLALPIMAVTLFFFPEQAAWYVSYVLLFNVLVGPVFSAGTFTSERERRTLELLLVTTLSPTQILFGKLLAGLRISSVLTGFLLWPPLMACALVGYYWSNLATMGGYVLIVLTTCVTTAMVALFCSVILPKTSTSMMAAYLALAALFIGPPAAHWVAMAFDVHPGRLLDMLSATSPFSAAFSLPLRSDDAELRFQGNLLLFGAHIGVALLINFALALGMTWMFRRRWLFGE